VFFNTSDGYDGRPGFSHTNMADGSHDWVGLFKEGDCDHREPNKHLRNKCFLQWEYVPFDKAHGHVFFRLRPHPMESGYKHAGNYEVRYFYGHNPNIANFFPGAMHQGYGKNKLLFLLFYVCSFNRNLVSCHVQSVTIGIQPTRHRVPR